MSSDSERELQPLTTDPADLETGKGGDVTTTSQGTASVAVPEPDQPLSVPAQLGIIVFSIASSVFLVTCNKYLVRTMKWNFPTVLTALHMLATLSYAHGVKLIKGSPDEPMLPDQVKIMYGISLALSVVSMNLSLTFNSVSVYQLAKLLIAPVIVGIELMMFQKRPSKAIAISLAVITVGIFWVTTCCRDGARAREQTSFGYAMALCAIATTALNQVWTGKLQNDPKTKVSALELMRQALPYAFLAVVVLAVFIDNVNPSNPSSLLNYPVSFPWIIALIMSCTGAFCVNFATTLVIGKFSPITYQVIGHSKTVLLLTSGAVLFGDKTITQRSLPGLGIAVGGLVGYTREKIRAKS